MGGSGERASLGASCRYCGSSDTWVEMHLEATPPQGPTPLPE